MTRSEQTKASWLNPDIALARRTRVRVIVNGQTYRSLSVALKALGLPFRHRRSMRRELKETGMVVFNGVQFRKEVRDGDYPQA